MLIYLLLPRDMLGRPLPIGTVLDVSPLTAESMISKEEARPPTERETMRYLQAIRPHYMTPDIPLLTR